MKKPIKVAATAAGALCLTLPAIATASVAADATTASGGGTMFTAQLDPVAHNRVDGSGWATVWLDGRTARITIHVNGLLNDAAHAMHIHARAEGECPEAMDATLHNGHLAMSTTDGLKDYGSIFASLTTRGDTSPASALALNRFPHAGTYVYNRTITLSAAAASAVRDDTGVIVIHGIDYNHNNRYDNVLGPSDLTPTLPMEATAPAICGPLVPSS